MIKYVLIEYHLNPIQIQTEIKRAAVGGDVNRVLKTLHNTVFYGLFSDHGSARASKQKTNTISGPLNSFLLKSTEYLYQNYTQCLNEMK